MIAQAINRPFIQPMQPAPQYAGAQLNLAPQVQAPALMPAAPAAPAAAPGASGAQQGGGQQFIMGLLKQLTGGGGASAGASGGMEGAADLASLFA